MWTPSANCEDVMVTELLEQVPDPIAVLVLGLFVKRLTVLVLVQVISKVGVLSEVMLSVFEDPRSEASVKSGVEGASTVEVEVELSDLIVIVRSLDVLEELPATSV